MVLVRIADIESGKFLLKICRSLVIYTATKKGKSRVFLQVQIEIAVQNGDFFFPLTYQI